MVRETVLILAGRRMHNVLTVNLLLLTAPALMSMELNENLFTPAATEPSTADTSDGQLP